MLRICRAVNVLVGIHFDLVQHITSDVQKIRDESIVHNCMPTERERMIVGRSDCRSGGCSNMGKACRRGGIAADAVEVCVVCGRLAVLVDRWPFALTFAKVGACFRVPCYAKAINVEEAIAQRNFCLGGRMVRIMRE